MGFVREVGNWISANPDTAVVTVFAVVGWVTFAWQRWWGTAKQRRVSSLGGLIRALQGLLATEADLLKMALADREEVAAVVRQFRSAGGVPVEYLKAVEDSPAHPPVVLLKDGLVRSSDPERDDAD